MASVEEDFSSFADNGMIDRGKIVKVVRKVNEDIGLKIYREKEVMIDIDNYKGELPLDFAFMQMAVACHVEYAYAHGSIFGTHTEDKEVPVTSYCATPPTCMNECGGCYWVTQRFQDKVIKYPKLYPLRLTKNSHKFCSPNCINYRWDNREGYQIDFDNEEIITDFKQGKIYISYLADMIDEDGNLLLLDHPLTTEYYEYAVKKHLLENWMINSDADVSQKLGYIKGELREARIRSMNFINTPEYSEIKDTYNKNRVMFYDKYHKMFN